MQPPTWRRDVDGKADLVEEVARIAGYDALPAEPLPTLPRAAGGVLTLRQSAHPRRPPRAGRRRLRRGADLVVHRPRDRPSCSAAASRALVLANPIAAELDCMRPSILPNLIEAVGRNARRGFPDGALFEIGPVFAGDRPHDQRTAIAAVARAARAAPLGRRRRPTTSSR